MNIKNLFRPTFFVLLACLIFPPSNAQKPEKLASGEIYRAIEKLNFLGSALYIAAHPDDENTRLISHLSNDVLARTAYLSLTRGDGGQNRIGPEITELLGVIRTQELLSARRIDGGSQFFTRANDFGYSKTSKETLDLWNKDDVLSDVVWVIRNFKPDIIINRFDHSTQRRTHGHHTSSAMLSVEAFDLAGDKNVYPEQLKLVDLWQPSREFFNTGWWFYGSRDNFAKADKSNLVAVDVGGYLPHLGKSSTEIAAESRSMHKSQGFGATGSRGTQMEYLELIKGDLPKDKENIFDGINTSWSRVKGASHIEALISNVLTSYDFLRPYRSVPELLKIKSEIQGISDKHWKVIKSKEIDRIILAATGMFVEFVANEPYANPGDEVIFRLEAINRSPLEIELASIVSSVLEMNVQLNKSMPKNQNERFEYAQIVSKEILESNPYWLNKPGTIGMYNVDNQDLIGMPENEAAIAFDVVLLVEGEPISFKKDLVYKYNDPVKGEVYRPFTIVPKVSLSIDEDVYIFPDQQAKEITIKVKSLSNDLSGNLSLCTGKEWKAHPDQYKVSLSKKGQEAFYSFKVKGPVGQNANVISPIFTDENDQAFTKEVVEIVYDHIPLQTVVRNAEAKTVRIEIEKEGNKIAYVEGAGDKVAESLRQIGYQVDEFHPEDLTSTSLESYDACIVGIRAFNVHRELKLKNQILFDYAKKGGTVIVQYQTSRGGLKGTDLSPLPLELGQARVTDEYSEVIFESPDHPILNYPNKISREDFEDWVQERGLYFPREWHVDYAAVLAMNDKGEDLAKGALLVAPYGEGHYIYTGISFFRELPAGVPGAYRLLANLISVGNKSSKL